MASARSARPERRPSTQRPRARPRARPGGAGGLRWDRFSRVSLLVVLVGIFVLYIGPVRSYWPPVQEAQHRRADVSQLERENARLRGRRAALRNAAALERE